MSDNGTWLLIVILVCMTISWTVLIIGHDSIERVKINAESVCKKVEQ